MPVVSLTPVSMTVYIGIDPGASGGLVALHGGRVTSEKMPESERDLWDWFCAYTLNADCFAVIEQQSPRPTRWFNKIAKQWNSSILKSTCLLWGRYCQLRGMLIAAGVSFEECPPKRWQGGLGIVPRKKAEDETEVEWKNRLKQRAQQLFPKETVTLATADALLLAEYCRRVHQGKVQSNDA